MAAGSACGNLRARSGAVASRRSTAGSARTHQPARRPGAADGGRDRHAPAAARSRHRLGAVSRPPSRHRRAPVVGRCASAAGNAVGEGVASGARRTSRVAGAIGEDDTAEIHEEREASRASRVCLRPEPDRVRDVELFGADDGLGWRRRAIPQGGSFRCDRTIPTMGIPRRFRAVSPRHLSVWRAATSPRSPACCPLVIAGILGERRTARGPYRLSHPSIPVSIRSIRNDRGWRIRSVHVGPSPSTVT